MSNNMKDRLDALRGPLPEKGLGARGLEHFARNPDCTRLVAVCLAGLRPGQVATEVYGADAEEGQSPFALATGSKFEKLLFAQDAERLTSLYVENGRLPQEGARVVSIPELVPGTDAAARIRRREVTLALLERKLRGEPDAPHLIIHPRIQVTLLGRTCEIEPDALVASDSDTFYRVVEIKSYVDRRGKTSSTALRGACRQAAVGVVGLRQESSALSCAEQMVGRIKAQADLILRRPGSMLPTLHPMSLQGEVESLELALGRAGRELGVIESLLEAGESLSTPEALNKLPKHYTEGCREFCALAPVCKRQALECSEPALLGNGVREALRSVGSLARALDLLHGRAQPASAQEDVLCVRLQQALVEHRRALSDAG